ncbi:MAG: ImmA/IrrE family metallo-endopeptidase [Nitrospirae bacterium]|nr:ImmA/IrrE family metallo-endopeptidase [Nitrospirota bacterium]
MRQTGNKVRAEFITNHFNISSFKNSDEAFEGWKNLLEDKGLLVFQISIPQGDIKGFSLIEGDLPAIVVNKKDLYNAKIFSLFHELAHILLNEGGICDMREDTHSPAIEKFCNHFAGSFLVPAKQLLKQDLVKQQCSLVWDSHSLKFLADKFRVSKEVVLRRLLILGKTSNSFYEKWRDEHIKEFKPFGKRGDPVRSCVKERGEKYVAMVFSAYNQDKINTLDAAGYLGVKIDQIQKVRELVTTK